MSNDTTRRLCPVMPYQTRERTDVTRSPVSGKVVTTEKYKTITSQRSCLGSECAWWNGTGCSSAPAAQPTEKTCVCTIDPPEYDFYQHRFACGHNLWYEYRKNDEFKHCPYCGGRIIWEEAKPDEA